MKIYDISQELFTCSVFPGDKQPVRDVVETIEGVYLLNAAPINLGQADVAPCRAVLIKE